MHHHRSLPLFLLGLILSAACSSSTSSDTGGGGSTLCTPLHCTDLLIPAGQCLAVYCDPTGQRTSSPDWPIGCYLGPASAGTSCGTYDDAGDEVCTGTCQLGGDSGNGCALISCGDAGDGG
jgi:hypothetical protein